MHIAHSYYFLLVSALRIQTSPPRTILARLCSKYPLNWCNDKPNSWGSCIYADIIYYGVFWGMFTPSPTWMSCQAVAIDIQAQSSVRGKEGNSWVKVRRRKQMRRRCRRNKTRVGKQRELRERETAKTPNGGTIIQLVVSLSRVRESVRGEKEATVTVGVRENKLALPVSASKPCRVIYSPAHTPTHPLNAST